MLDLGWTEILVIGVVALIVIGPRDLPMALHTFGKYVGKLKSMARDFQHGIDEIARQHELRDLQQGINKFSSPKQAIDNYVSDLEGRKDKAPTGDDSGKAKLLDDDEAATDQANIEDWSAASAEAASPAAKAAAERRDDEPELALDQTATDDAEPELTLDRKSDDAAKRPEDQSRNAEADPDKPKPGPTASS